MRIFITLLSFFIVVPNNYAMAPKINWHKAVNIAVEKYGLKSEPDLKRAFKKAKISYPPKEITFLTFKKERKIELWARNDKQWQWIKNYPLTAYSGLLGPKLKEHDRQIPEGIYHLTLLNPFSSFHLSIKLDYPNQFDKSIARLERRHNLGNNIFMHGKSVSVGCLAVGDTAIDQIFLLVSRVGLANSKIIIAPNDMRAHPPATQQKLRSKWVKLLYKKINVALKPFKHSKTT